MDTWIIVANYALNETIFYQLRLCIESILREVPRGDYVKLLVVDDHSTYDYAAYRDCHKNDDRIEFLLLGDPLPSYYGAKGRGGEQGRLTSGGHGVALHSATLHAKKQGAKHVWTLDSDTFILDGGCLGKAMGVMHSDDIIRSVGDYAWGRPGVRNGLCFKDHCLTTKRERRDKYNPKEGKTNAICALWSLEDYPYLYQNKVDWGGTHIGDTYWARFETMGQAATRVVEGLWTKDLATAYFPFFWDPYVMHFGYGSLLFTREQAGVRGVGNAPDVRVQYGHRIRGDYSTGFLQLKCPTAAFHKHLHELYQNRPFDDVSARFDRNLLVPPRPVRTP